MSEQKKESIFVIIRRTQLPQNKCCSSVVEVRLKSNHINFHTLYFILQNGSRLFSVALNFILIRIIYVSVLNKLLKNYN